MKKLIAALAISAFSFTAAQAAELAEIDSDANGMISMEEAKAANITEEAFSGADADKDGSLNAEELASISN
ncbi:MAG: hypothetical protein OER56_03300 [Hyphomicrobiales bacterium]|nr:hypothetical protein [Hyphomicrobiales bacterium]